MSDLCAGPSAGQRGAGREPGITTAVFEAVHGSAPDIAGKNMANPTALLLALLMLEHIGEAETAGRIRSAIYGILGAGTVRTHDMGGSASTTEFTAAVCAAIEQRA